MFKTVNRIKRHTHFGEHARHFFGIGVIARGNACIRHKQYAFDAEPFEKILYIFGGPSQIGFARIGGIADKQKMTVHSVVSCVD